MSYYSRIDLYSLQVRPEKVAEVADAIAAARSGGDQPFGVAALLLEPDGSLWWDWDYDISDVQKWNLNEPLVGLLAEWCEYGWVAFWSCEGDGGQWAFELDGEGGFSECSARRVSGFRAADTRMLRREGLE